RARAPGRRGDRGPGRPHPDPLGRRRPAVEQGHPAADAGVPGDRAAGRRPRDPAGARPAAGQAPRARADPPPLPRGPALRGEPRGLDRADGGADPPHADAALTARGRPPAGPGHCDGRRPGRRRSRAGPRGRPRIGPHAGAEAPPRSRERNMLQWTKGVRAWAAALAVAFAGLLAPAAHAEDVVVLKDGTELRGEIQNEHDGWIWLKRLIGGIEKVEVISPDRVESVQRDAEEVP